MKLHFPGALPDNLEVYLRDIFVKDIKEVAPHLNLLVEDGDLPRLRRVIGTTFNLDEWRSFFEVKADAAIPDEPRQPGHDEAGHDEAGHDEAGHDEAGHDEAGHGEAGHDEASDDEEEGTVMKGYIVFPLLDSPGVILHPKLVWVSDKGYEKELPAFQVDSRFSHCFLKQPSSHAPSLQTLPPSAN
ncbi:hypothetical protein F5880DRAFT_381336 [Lentinula raphanica]|nr:hypothetical protein F5880DRAFT_381336 [Lentinula raphanica]